MRSNSGPDLASEQTNLASFSSCTPWAPAAVPDEVTGGLVLCTAGGDASGPGGG